MKRETAGAATWAEHSLKLFQSLVHQLNDAIFIVDPDTSAVLYANERACANLGYSAAEISGLRVIDFALHARDEAAWREYLARIRGDGFALFQSEHRRKDGSAMPVEVNARLISHGGREYFISMVRDITIRRRSEAALRRANRALQTLSRANEALMRSVDEEDLLDQICHIVIEAGGYRFSWVGYAEQDGERTVRPVAHCGREEGYLADVNITWSDKEHGRGPTGTAIRTGRAVAARDIERNLEYAPWRREALRRGYKSSLALPLTTDAGTIGALNIYAAEPDAFDDEEMKILSDLANDLAYGIQALRVRKQQTAAEESLRAATRKAQEERMKTEAVIAAIGHAISIQDREYRVLYQNDVHKGIMGDQVGKYCYQMYEKRDGVCEGCPVAQAYEDGRVHTVERSMENDGATRYYEITASPLRDVDGAIIAGIEVAREVTDRKQRDVEQQKLLAIIENNTDFIGLAAPDGRVLYVNPAGRRMVGLDTLERVQGTRTRDYHMTDDLPEFENVIMPRFLESGLWRGEYRFRHFATGQAVPVEVNCFIMRAAAGSPVALAMIGRDISDRKKLEAQLVQSQKMESVGRLAGGIAHDFNNILTAIIGYSELLLMQLTEANPMRHNIASIRESADRAAVLTNQLLAFSRQQVLEMQVVDLNGVIEGMFGMLRRMIGEDVTLDLRLAPKARNVMADPGQISQVVMNLAVNARDAMPGGGKLTIATEDVDLSAAEAGVLELSAGTYAVLSVADTGHGMSEVVMNRIFDPFFTTKEVGKGTGLGLATAYGIIKQHNGHISVESEVGAGSVFRIYLPVAAGGAATMPAPKPLNMPRGSETIMLVEDEPALLQLMTTIIGSLGYRVLTAADGKQALKIAEQHPGPVHVLLTDVIMPGMNGRMLADLLMKQHPETKVMFMSGYTEDFIAHHGVLEEGRVLVRKPLKPQELAEKLREVLDRP